MLRTLDCKIQGHLHVYMCIIKAKGVTWRKEKKRVKVDLVLFIDRSPSRKKKALVIIQDTFYVMLC